MNSSLVSCELGSHKNGDEDVYAPEKGGTKSAVNTTDEDIREIR